ncbi:hypothetical protein TCAL_08225 [Tigriopus californicus]|uniref:Peptidase M14 domain-containing protein n=1 Tax=Tigriopus californicus TaxID=6832 RepID=A0A553NFI4_TIGCA|nr:cytosolic carboxypeptidase-like protein 5 [Tigriopus californicus]TRY64129.1 hypothetical protein TCAL_08225 [Tigriopus californicus]|eukprot:TCALIF_08225-PA protein Name:"Similar to agbl5 Cytosolic carboxypeptidase-like protein 5 (Danio rerio)" AED:0.15 eAED:0.16 QI:0/-1/0/1/-1/1/1/0/984
MECQVSGFQFFSNFDSGNLNRVEATDVSAPLGPTHKPFPPPEVGGEPTDFSFNMWTRPDCHGTEFENGNRTWFYFGIVKGSEAGGMAIGQKYAVLRFTFRNLNKQSKLFSQGMTPICATTGMAAGNGLGRQGVPPGQSARWERLREKPIFWTEDNNFVLSFRVRIDPKVVTYLAFTYPFSYREVQSFVGKLERRHDTSGLSYDVLKAKAPTSIYFHREVLCQTSEGRNVDLITLSSTNNILSSRESGLMGLFQSDRTKPRPLEFQHKKVIFVSARVHPGETQSSFVFNGMLRFLLRETDPRAVALRKKYVFKLIPMLNPDGVFRGHYRTDLRGVNLNRIYSSPSLALHMPIYAAKKLILYAHFGYDVQVGSPVHEEESNSTLSLDTVESESGSSSWFYPMDAPAPFRWLRSSTNNPPVASAAPGSGGVSTEQFYEMTETSRCSEGDESIADFSISSGSGTNTSRHHPDSATAAGLLGPTSFTGAFSAIASDPCASTSTAVPGAAPTNARLPMRLETQDETAQDSCDALPALSPNPPPLVDFEEQVGLDFAEKLKDTINPPSNTEKKPTPVSGKSGLFLYIDIHGHASKRGVFMYGNHFHDLTSKVDTMLLPKLMSINCANFDFPGCNFTQKNMYMKDRHTGAGKEGSGRVSVFKSTGCVYSYTLECNFNTGRVVNPIPSASRDAGRATPPPPLEATPPKYDPFIYEDVGKSLAISILDLTECNPWTRLTCSPHRNLKGVRESIRKYIRQNEEQQKLKAANSSPKGSKARNRSVSTSSAASNASGSGSKTSKSPKSRGMKTPLSPDAYRPIPKVPRKNSIVSRNLNQQLQQQSGSSSVTPNNEGARNILNKKSMSGIAHLPPNALAPIITDSLDKDKLFQRSKLTRSQSLSTPNSRPSSPRRTQVVSPTSSEGGTQRRLKKKKTKTTVDKVRKASLGGGPAAALAPEPDSSSGMPLPTGTSKVKKKKKLGVAAKGAKKRKQTPKP